MLSNAETEKINSLTRNMCIFVPTFLEYIAFHSSDTQQHTKISKFQANWMIESDS